MQAWDLGGHEAVRYLWFDFLSDSHAIVFMIDRADGERLEEAHWELSELLSDVSPLKLDVSFRLTRAELLEDTSVRLRLHPRDQVRKNALLTAPRLRRKETFYMHFRSMQRTDATSLHAAQMYPATVLYLALALHTLSIVAVERNKAV